MKYLWIPLHCIACIELVLLYFVELCMDTHLTKTFLNDLVFNNKHCDSWDFSYKITYGDVIKLFDFLDKENFMKE